MEMVYFAIIAAVVLGGSISLYLWWERQVLVEVLRERCLGCNRQVVARGSSGHYVCSYCRYDSKMGNEKVPQLIDALRHLRSAIDHANRAVSDLEDGATSAANTAISNAMQDVHMASVVAPEVVDIIRHPVLVGTGNSAGETGQKLGEGAAKLVGGAISPFLGLAIDLVTKSAGLVQAVNAGHAEAELSPELNKLSAYQFLEQIRGLEANMKKRIYASVVDDVASETKASRA